ncbi:MAG TPA: T9SS type A sorting domain-containing protein [Saprospiraceae bacterium]|nr:T9SS type A sorting domain-containing protein [Saprospiraceae bacterium]
MGGYIFNQWTNQNGPYPYDDIDNFIQEAEDMNADMVIGINFGSGTPQLAKDLVNYLKNHPTKGNLLPKVAFFELGNEISGEWQKGHTSSCDGEQYAYNAVDFINKMREADPNIKIGVPMADTYSFGWAPFGYPNDICQSYPLPYCTNNPNNWQFNIDKTIEIIGDKIDYIIFHGYSPWPLFQPASGNCANASYSDVNEMGKRLLAAAPYGTNFIENNVRVQLNASKIAHGVTRDIKFANTEFFSHVDIGTSNTSTGAQLSHSISEAIFSADGILNALKYDYGSAINFSFYHCNSSSGGGFPCASDFSSNLLFDITSNGQSFSHKPSFNVHELLAENLGTQVIGDLITGNPQFNYTSCSDPNQMVTYDKIGLLSTKAADGTLYLLVINRGNTDQTVKIDPHMSYNSASIRSIYGSGYGDHNPTYTPSFSNISDLNAVNIKKLSINIIKIGSTPSSCVITMNTFTSSDGSTCDTYTLDITGNQSSGQIIIPITNLPGNGFNPNQTSATSGTLSWLSSTGLKWTIPSISQGQNYTATMTYCWAALASPTATYNQGTCNESITASSSSPLVSNNNNLQFAVAKNHRKVDINWLTTTDFKNEKFIIQRSADGATFQDLTELESITQNTAPQLYKSVDKQPLFGANFYRLKQVFEDGTFEYSNTQKVLFNIDLNEISVYPNPANTEIFVAIKQLAGRKGTLKIINTLGEVQHELDLEKTTTELVSFDLNGYVNGLYIIAIDVEGKRKITRKFVVAKK